MQGISSDEDFAEVNERFEENKKTMQTDCGWTMFIPIHKKVSKNRCPICEQELDVKNNSGVTIRSSASSIDHFRPKRNEKNDKLPKDAYSFLECEESNYIIMCKTCNDGYKKSEFPLNNDYVATNISEIRKEEPLLINLREEDPLNYFKIVFTEMHLPLPILELKIRDNIIQEGGYKYNKAKETIKLFRLGNCHVDEPKTTKKGLYNNFECRVFTLAEHYDVLIEIAKAIQDKKDFEELLKLNPNILEYGFFRFLINKQFEIEEL